MCTLRLGAKTQERSRPADFCSDQKNRRFRSSIFRQCSLSAYSEPLRQPTHVANTNESGLKTALGPVSEASFRKDHALDVISPPKWFYTASEFERSFERAVAAPGKHDRLSASGQPDTTITNMPPAKLSGNIAPHRVRVDKRSRTPAELPHSTWATVLQAEHAMVDLARKRAMLGQG